MHLETVPHRRHLKGLTESWRCWRGFWHDMQLQVCKAFAFKKKKEIKAPTLPACIFYARTLKERKTSTCLSNVYACVGKRLSSKFVYRRPQPQKK